jgi:hypothetical protein
MAQTERIWQRSPAVKPQRSARLFGEADVVDALRAPLARPLRGGGTTAATPIAGSTGAR